MQLIILETNSFVSQVLFCIGDLFKGAKDIQNWLNICARLIAKSIPQERVKEAMELHTTSIRAKKRVPSSTRLKKEQMTSVVWTTPMGLPIVQPYRKTKRKQIMTSLQTVFISDPNSPAEGTSLSLLRAHEHDLTYLSKQLTHRSKHQRSHQTSFIA